MRRNSSGISLRVLATLFGFGLASTVMAQAVTPPVVRSPGKNTAHSRLMKELRAAHLLLAEADHDYQGHRAKAAKEVHKALSELGYHHHPTTAHPGTAIPGGAVATRKAAAVHQSVAHEPQATSDTQLRKARQILRGALTQLNSRRPKAAADLRAAIGEIDRALSIR